VKVSIGEEPQEGFPSKGETNPIAWAGFLPYSCYTSPSKLIASSRIGIETGVRLEAREMSTLWGLSCVCRVGELDGPEQVAYYQGSWKISVPTAWSIIRCRSLSIGDSRVAVRLRSWAFEGLGSFIISQIVEPFKFE
jgi:hypothetical protein